MAPVESWSSGCRDARGTSVLLPSSPTCYWRCQFRPPDSRRGPTGPGGPPPRPAAPRLLSAPTGTSILGPGGSCNEWRAMEAVRTTRPHASTRLSVERKVIQKAENLLPQPLSGLSVSSVAAAPFPPTDGPTLKGRAGPQPPPAPLYFPAPSWARRSVNERPSDRQRTAAAASRKPLGRSSRTDVDDRQRGSGA